MSPTGLLGRLDLRRVLRSGSGLTGVGLVASAAAQLIANLVMVGTQTPSVYADVAVLTLAVLFLAMFFRLGIDRMVVPEIRASAEAAGHAASMRAGASLLSAALASALVGTLLVGLGPLRVAMDPTLSEPLTRTEGWLVAGWLAAEIVRFVVSEIHRAEGGFVLAAVGGNGLRAPLFLLLVVGMAVADVESRTALLAAAASSSVAVLALCGARVGTRFRWWTVNPLPDLVRRVSQHSVLLASTLAAALIGGADVWLVGWYFSDEQTAQYAFAVSIVAGLAMLTAALSGGLAPRLAELLSARKVAEAQAVLRLPTRVVAALTVAGYLVLVVVTEPVAVAVGGSAYDEMTPLVAILGMAHVAGACAGIAGWVLVFARRYASMSIVTIVVAILGIGLELIAGGVLESLLWLTVASALATASIHVVSAVVAARWLGVRTDVFAR